MELVIVALVLLVLVLLWDRSRYPRKFCRSCKGTGRVRSRVAIGAFGLCRRCGGKGELRR